MPKLKFFRHCTEYPPQYWCYPPHVPMLSPNVLNTLHSTEAIPHCTDVIPPLYWTTSTVLKLSLTVLKLSPHMYCCYPPQHWRYPSTVLDTLHSTDVIPHSTDVIPCMYWCYPQLYWTTSTVLKLSPHSTDVIRPMHWTTSNVLNNLHSTEPTLYGVEASCTKSSSYAEFKTWLKIQWYLMGLVFILLAYFVIRLWP